MARRVTWSSVQYVGLAAQCIVTHTCMDGVSNKPGSRLIRKLQNFTDFAALTARHIVLEHVLCGAIYRHTWPKGRFHQKWMFHETNLSWGVWGSLLKQLHSLEKSETLWASHTPTGLVSSWNHAPFPFPVASSSGPAPPSGRCHTAKKLGRTVPGSHLLQESPPSCDCEI